MKTLFLFLFISISFSVCAQKPENEKLNIDQMEKNMIQKEFGHLFYLDYEHNNCSYEILINDVPLITFYGLGERNTNADINQYLLKPGKQEITIRLYPKKIDNTVFKPSLDSTSYVNVLVRKGKAGSLEWSLSDEGRKQGKKIEVLSYQTPKLENSEPFAEFQLSFEVNAEELTWEIPGWSESQVLQNNEVLKQEVFEFYKNFQQIIENQNKNVYMNLIANSVFEEAASWSWRSKEILRGALEDLEKTSIHKQKFLFPINEETAELKFYGNGRVVTLVSKDPHSFGYSPLVAKAEKNNFPIAYTFYLHKPKGSNKLEIIR